MRLKKPPRKQLRLLAGSVTLVIIVAAVAFVINSGFPEPLLEIRDQQEVTHDMAVLRPYLQQKVEPLGIVFGQPEATTCGPGDPSLYAFTCGTRAGATLRNSGPTNPTVLAQRLQTLDQQLQANGWHRSSNDFRAPANQPYNGWAQTIAAYGVDIEYSKGTCDFEATIAPSFPSSEGFDGLACTMDDGPPD